MMYRNQSSLFVFIVVVTIGVLKSTASGASATEQEPSRAYFLGLARYLTERGYVAAISPRIEGRDVEICYKQIPVSKELGSTIDFRFAIPAWHIQGTIRKSNFKIEETGEWVQSKTFRAGSFGLLRTAVDGTWRVVRTDADEIYKTKSVPRPLSAEVKQAILSQLLHHTVSASEMMSYRFSVLEQFENRLWIYNTAAGKLFEVSAAADLDDPETIRHGIPNWNGYDHSETDLAEGPLIRTVKNENVVWLHGLWAALGGRKLAE